MSFNRQHQGLLKDLEDVLQCPVCLETFREPPIYLCENQHGMCLRCRTAVMNPPEDFAVICCPVCQGKLTEKRSLYVEQILDKLPEKCMHDNCCFKTFDRALLKTHEDMCQQRLVPCGHCDTRISLKMLTQHLDSAHNRAPISKEDPIALGTAFPIRFAHTGMWRLSVKDTGIHFFLHLTPLDNYVMLVWVSCSLPESKAKNYQYSVNVTGPNSSYTGHSPCVSCDVLPSDVKKSGNGLHWIKQISCDALVTVQRI